MRWELLFADVETQLHAATQRDLELNINELARVEASQLTLAEVLRGAWGGRLSVVMCNGTAFHGQVSRVEAQWALLNEDSRSVLLPLAKILRVEGVGVQRTRAPGRVSYTLPAALRVLARNRSAVVLDLDSSHPSAMRGVLDQVGADFVQLMQLADGVGRDRENVQGAAVVPIAALVSVVSSPENEF